MKLKSSYQSVVEDKQSHIAAMMDRVSSQDWARVVTNPNTSQFGICDLAIFKCALVRSTNAQKATERKL